VIVLIPSTNNMKKEAIVVFLINLNLYISVKMKSILFPFMFIYTSVVFNKK
jgi:hypothetical protein